MFKRGTTYPITLTVPVDLTNAEWVIVSVKPRDCPEFELTGEDLTVTYDGRKSSVTFQFTQEQSLALPPIDMEIDLNYKIDGFRKGPRPVIMDVTDTLLDRVI